MAQVGSGKESQVDTKPGSGLVRPKTWSDVCYRIGGLWFRFGRLVSIAAKFSKGACLPVGFWNFGGSQDIHGWNE
jgi:hypothetical protein